MGQTTITDRIQVGIKKHGVHKVIMVVAGGMRCIYMLSVYRMGDYNRGLGRRSIVNQLNEVMQRSNRGISASTVSVSDDINARRFPITE